MQTTSPCDASQDVSTQTSDQPASSFSFDVAVQTSFHSVHISSLDAAVQTLPHSTVSQDVSTQMGARSASSFSLDAAVQTPIRSTVSHDTSTQLPLTEFFIGCIFSNDPFDRQGSSSAQGDIGSASPPQPPDIATTCSLSSSSLDRDDHVRTLAPRVLLQPPPGLEQYAPPPGLDIDAHLCTSHGIPVKGHLYDPGYVQLSQSRPHSLLLAPSMWEHIMRDQLPPAREVLVLLWREPTILSIQILVQGLALFLNREHSFFLWSTLVNPNLMSTVILIQPTVISCIINTVFSVPQWNPGPARKNLTNIIAAACGRFHAVILQEASDHVQHISGQFIAHTGNTDLAILLNKDTFEPDPTVLAFRGELHKPKYVGHGATHRSLHFLEHQLLHLADSLWIFSRFRSNFPYT